MCCFQPESPETKHVTQVLAMRRPSFATRCAVQLPWAQYQQTGESGGGPLPLSPYRKLPNQNLCHSLPPESFEV